MKLWSTWFLKSEVRRGDTCPEPTELRLIGGLTWINVDPKIQIKYVDAETPTRRHVDERHFPVWWVNEIVFSVCSTSWVFRCTFAAFLFAIQKNRTPCRSGRMQEEKLEKRNVWLRSRNQWWLLVSKDCQSVSNNIAHLEALGHSKQTVRIQTVLVRRDPLRKVWMKTHHRILTCGIRIANTITSTGRLVPETTKKTIGAKLSHHNFEISRNNVGHVEERLIK